MKLVVVEGHFHRKVSSQEDPKRESRLGEKSPVVVSQRKAIHPSGLNSQIFIRLQGIRTLLKNIKCREKGKGMLRAESLSCSHNEIRSLVVVVEDGLTIFPSFGRIPRPSLSGVRRSTIDWQSHLFPEFQLLNEENHDDIKALLQRSICRTKHPSIVPMKKKRGFEYENTTNRAEVIIWDPRY